MIWALQDGGAPAAVACIEYLGLFGGLVDTKSTPGGLTALHMAAEKGHSHAVEQLCRLGAKLDVVTMTGKTALHLASREGHLDVVKILTNEERSRLKPHRTLTLTLTPIGDCN